MSSGQRMTEAVTDAMADEAIGAICGALAPALVPPRAPEDETLREMELRLRAENAEELLREALEVIGDVADDLQRMADDAFEYVGRHPQRGHRGGAELEELYLKLRALRGGR